MSKTRKTLDLSNNLTQEESLDEKMKRLGLSENISPTQEASKEDTNTTLKQGEVTSNVTLVTVKVEPNKEVISRMKAMQENNTRKEKETLYCQVKWEDKTLFDDIRRKIYNHPTALKNAGIRSVSQDDLVKMYVLEGIRRDKNKLEKTS